MKSFLRGQSVTVLFGPLAGRTGKVCRCRMGDNGAWVNIAGDPLPDKLRSFPANDENGRGNHVVLYPEDCKRA